jgi:hypothetical protein
MMAECMELNRRTLNRIMNQITNELQKTLSYAELKQIDKVKETIDNAVGQIKTLHGLTKTLLDKIDDL